MASPCAGEAHLRAGEQIDHPAHRQAGEARLLINAEGEGFSAWDERRAA